MSAIGRVLVPKGTFLALLGASFLVAACDSTGTGAAMPGGGGTTAPGTGGATHPVTSGAGGATASTATSTGGSTSAMGGAGGTPAMGGGGAGTSPPGTMGGAGGASTTGDAAPKDTSSDAPAPPGSGGFTTATGGVASASSGTTATGGRSAAAGGTTAAPGGTTGGSGGTPGAGGAGQPGSCAPPTTGHYQMEDLDRGVVAVKVSGGVYVGWRMMGYEYNPTSPSSVAYNVYRGGTKLATVTDSTNYLDASGSASSTYTVAVVMDGTECAQSPSVATWAQNYLRIPLDVPAQSPSGATYSANDGSPGDLDGDGIYDIVLKWDPSDAKDNSQSGVTSNVFLDGYTLAGKHLWRIDLGPNIRAGAHYTQFSVYDFDGDGKAEIACKTAPGTKDGTGAYLSKGPAASDDDSVKYANSDGYILSGPEYLTVFDGATGKELSTVSYPVPRGTVSSWGDSYGNRLDRFNGGFAFVSDTGSGKTATGRPSIIQQRGYYTRLTVSAYNWRNATLSKLWTFDSDGSGNGKAAGQGDHSAMAADVDGDGAQEIITGASTIGSDGTLKCTTGLGHGDAMHVGELVKGKGIAVFTVHESAGGMDCHDGATCAFYFNITKADTDTGRGVAEYVTMNDLTAATCSSSTGGNVNCSTGTTVSGNAGSNFLIYWDADEARELESDTSITKSGGGTLLSASGCASNNGTKSTPTLTADLLGDWREELVLRESNSSALRVYTTTDVTKRRIYTLMHDPTYRAQVSFEQSSYNQPPHVGFHIGAGMANPPKPDIFVK
jgi:rhamnogalacturonan endolyase